MKVSFSEVVRVDSVSKEDLYIRAREWFGKTFVSDQGFIQMEDKQAGKIIGKGVANSSIKNMFAKYPPFTLYYTANITIKDGRYRYEISDFMIEYYPNRYIRKYEKNPIETFYIDSNKRYTVGITKIEAKVFIKKVSETGKDLAFSLKEALRSTATGVKSKDDF